MFLLLAVGTAAEIEKRAQMCQTGICLYWWPKLPPVKGWHHDEGSSLSYGVNALAPDGSSFSDAAAVMYASALYKPRMPETDSLDKLIADDKDRFRSDFPGVAIAEMEALTTGDGRKMPALTFFPSTAKSKAQWEEVCYGEEGDFYLIFTLSARSRQGFDKAVDTYRDLIAHYKEHL